MKRENLDEWDRKHLLATLTALKDATDNNLPPIYHVGLVDALTRRYKDDKVAGRGEFQLIHFKACRGLRALEDDDLEGARQMLGEAETHASHLVIRLAKHGRLDHLRKGAAKRQRPISKTERNKRLAEANGMQLQQGLKGPAARRAAIQSDYYLLAEFGGLTDRQIRAALTQGQKNLED